mmetsp:Transcript_32068/g.78695  ORF Transcript_32068/g.78695 Transcript_32068/m.78695 type:complete len:223 (-) Transcript_32068:1332-2000(-)
MVGVFGLGGFWFCDMGDWRSRDLVKSKEEKEHDDSLVLYEASSLAEGVARHTEMQKTVSPGCDVKSSCPPMLCTMLLTMLRPSPRPSTCWYDLPFFFSNSVSIVSIELFLLFDDGIKIGVIPLPLSRWMDGIGPILFWREGPRRGDKEGVGASKEPVLVSNEVFLELPSLLVSTCCQYLLKALLTCSVFMPGPVSVTVKKKSGSSFSSAPGEQSTASVMLPL